MRKQTKLVAVLSAAALLAMGASMTSFAAGWEKDDAGVWHYYDSDDEMVTGEWKKDGGKWFYLDDDGNMLTDSWVDDDYYVGDDGAMLTNAWKYTMSDDDQDDPDEDGEHWYYFNNKGKKVTSGTSETKKINGKTYCFNEDGEMQYGWHEDDGNAYYLGTEDEGWRAESQWLWLEKSGNNENDLDDDDDLEVVLDCSEDDNCDDEGWYWFQSSGKAYHDTGKKKINGKYYMFNEHGQMLYEWIDGKAVEQGSNAQLDGNLAKGELATTSVMRYYNEVEDGSRGNGWYQIDGAEDLDADGDTDWYYIDDGEVKYADGGSKDFATYDDDGAVYVQRIKVEGKYFAFNEKGQMQDGLQYCQADGGFYYFDDNGYQKTGRVTSVENDDDDYTFYFNTKNGKNGLGYNGLKDDYLYFNGKRLDADDDYRLYYYDGDIYLTNTKGKVQKTSKKYDIENKGIAEDDVKVEISGKKVVSVTLASGKTIKAEELIADAEAQFGKDVVTEDQIVSVPFIQLYDDDIYTYTDLVGTKAVEGWLGLNK